MNPWETLNIDPTDDKKAIKKAYAVLIKQYKPDECPDKFKEIQAAYKSALAARQWQVEERFNEQVQLNDTDSQSQKDDLNDSETEGFNLSNAPVDEEQIKFDRQQQNIIDNLYKQLKEMAFAPLAVKDKLESWQFIEVIYKIDDIELKSEVSINVFNKVAEYNLFQLQKNGTLLINKDIVKYLNKVFDWGHEWKNYQSIFPDNYYIVNFQFIDAAENKKVKQKSLLSLRFWAFLVDTLFIFFIVLIMRIIQFSLDIVWFEGNIVAWLFLPMLFIIRLLFEIKSKNKRSLGKTSNNLIIVDKYGNLCSTKQTLLRHFILMAQLLLIFFIPMIINKYSNNEYVFLIAIYTFIFVNLGLYTFTKKMLHDFVSKTQVIKQLIISA